MVADFPEAVSIKAIYINYQTPPSLIPKKSETTHEPRYKQHVEHNSYLYVLYCNDWVH